MSNKKTFQCDCGFEWVEGASGTHNCTPFYRDRIRELKAKMPKSKATWWDITKAVLWILVILYFTVASYVEVRTMLVPGITPGDMKTAELCAETKAKVQTMKRESEILDSLNTLSNETAALVRGIIGRHAQATRTEVEALYAEREKLLKKVK